MSELTRDEMRDRLGNLDQIRDLLFGKDMQDYDRRFQKIESDLAALHQETQKTYSSCATSSQAKFKRQWVRSKKS